MFPMCTKMGGMAFGFPDVCKVPAPPAPPIPTPFPNTAQLATAVNFAQKTTVLNQPALTIKSEVPMTQGDEAGVAGGVSSGVNMNKCTFKVGATNVKVEGSDALNLLKMSGHNGASANMPAGTIVQPGQTLVKILG